MFAFHVESLNHWSSLQGVVGNELHADPFGERQRRPVHQYVALWQCQTGVTTGVFGNVVLLPQPAERRGPAAERAGELAQVGITLVVREVSAESSDVISLCLLGIGEPCLRPRGGEDRLEDVTPDRKPSVLAALALAARIFQR